MEIHEMTETVFERAFPSGRMSIGDGDAVAYERGMSLRDWFAGQALAGLLCAIGSEKTDLGIDRGRSSHGPDNLAFHAFRYADAMLAARGGSST